MNSIRAHAATTAAASVTSARTARTGPARTAFVNVAFAGAALFCVLAGQPALANESVAGHASTPSSLRVQPNGGEGIRVSGAAFALASADLDGMRRQPTFVSLPMGIEDVGQGRLADAEPQGSRATADVQRTISAASTIVEPITIAVLGFTAAALLGLSRRKSASAAPAALSE